MAKKVTPIIFRMADVDIERIVAELIDNSIEAGADGIGVRFFLTDESNDDVGMMVLDDGNGFDSTEALFDSMEIQTKNLTKRSSELGKYHIGMKLAPLSRYENLYVISIINGKTWITRAFNADRTGLNFDMDDSKGLNPTKPIPYNPKDTNIPSEIHIQLAGLKSDQGRGNFSDPKNCKWTTCVIAEKRWRDVLDDNFSAVQSMLDEKKFAKHLSQFLGLTYQKTLEKNPNLIIRVAENQIVKPYDPFLSNFTPSKIQSGINSLEDDLEKVKSSKEKEKIADKIDAAKALKKFGTLEGATYISPKFEGLKVTPYHIPVKDARSLLKKKLGQDWGGETQAFMESKVSNAGSNLLESKGICGFFFYRNDRLISFGQFYELNKIDNSANRIRIRVDFTGDLDEHIEVHPNKHKIDTKSTDLWNEVLQGLTLSSGGLEYAIPFNQSVPFFNKTVLQKPPAKKGAQSINLWKKFDPDNSSHYPNILALEDSKYIKYVSCEKCKFIHEPNGVCPQSECQVCGNEVRLNQCLPGDCKHQCKHCGRIGEHPDSKCPLLCKICGIDHKGSVCPKLCSSCNSEPCECPCKVCGETKPCSGCCGKCFKKIDNCECEQSDSKFDSIPNKETLILWKKNKSKNIELIQNAMAKLGISVEDLK